jgi:hypothetical protein
VALHLELDVVLNEPFSKYAVGDVIAGKYLLEGLLGAGSRGAVFKARNTALDMPLALRVMAADPGAGHDPQRIVQAARAAARLAHPAIVRVFDVGQTALGDAFIVMELLSGQSLAELLQAEGRLSGIRAVQVLLPIVDGLAVAHAKSFVHGSIQPSAVFVSRSEDLEIQPQLLGLGLGQGQAGVDERTDVWAFSALLYACLAGAPFRGSEEGALQPLEPDPLTLYDLGVTDGELSAIVSRGLSKQRVARGSMGQLGQALANWLVRQGIGEDITGVSLEAKWRARGVNLGEIFLELATHLHVRDVVYRGFYSETLRELLQNVGEVAGGSGELAIVADAFAVSFEAVVVIDARLARNEKRDFDLALFMKVIARAMARGLALELDVDAIHPEEIAQLLKDHRRILFCFFSMELLPEAAVHRLRGLGFTQSDHRVLYCGDNAFLVDRSLRVLGRSDELEARRMVSLRSSRLIERVAPSDDYGYVTPDSESSVRPRLRDSDEDMLHSGGRLPWDELDEDDARRSRRRMFVAPILFLTALGLLAWMLARTR